MSSSFFFTFLNWENRHGLGKNVAIFYWEYPCENEVGFIGTVKPVLSKRSRDNPKSLA